MSDAMSAFERFVRNEHELEKLGFEGMAYSVEYNRMVTENADLFQSFSKADRDIALNIGTGFIYLRKHLEHVGSKTWPRDRTQ